MISSVLGFPDEGVDESILDNRGQRHNNVESNRDKIFFIIINSFINIVEQQYNIK